MLKIKKYIYTKIVKAKAKSYGKNLKVNEKSIVTNRTILGDNVNFNGLRIGGSGSVTIGNNFHSGKEILIITQNHNYNHGQAIPYDSKYDLKEIIIEDNVWIGTRVIILGNVKIGEGAIVQAGSVVVNDIPKYGIAGGHPAKVFKFRDKEHYEKLKEKRYFH